MLESIKDQIRLRYEAWCDVESITIDPDSEIIVTEIDTTESQRLQLSLKIFYTVTARHRFLGSESVIYNNSETFTIPHLFHSFIYQRDCGHGLHRTTN